MASLKLSAEGHLPLSQGGFFLRCAMQRSLLVMIQNLGRSPRRALMSRVLSWSLWEIRCMLGARMFDSHGQVGVGWEANGKRKFKTVFSLRWG